MAQSLRGGAMPLRKGKIKNLDLLASKDASGYSAQAGQTRRCIGAQRRYQGVA